MPGVINPQKGIDLMNNKSTINRILFAVTIFQHLCGVMESDDNKGPLESQLALRYPMKRDKIT